MATWQIQEAKAHLGKVIDAAQTSGPQTITRKGVAEAVVLSAHDYRNLVSLRPDYRSQFLVPPIQSTIDPSSDDTV